MKSLAELAKEQAQRESSILAHLIREAGGEELVHFEADLSEQRSRVLFKLTEEIEDTDHALKQADQLVQRLKKHLSQLKDLQQVLSKQ